MSYIILYCTLGVSVKLGFHFFSDNIILAQIWPIQKTISCRTLSYSYFAATLGVTSLKMWSRIFRSITFFTSWGKMGWTTIQRKVLPSIMCLCWSVPSNKRKEMFLCYFHRSLTLPPLSVSIKINFAWRIIGFGEFHAQMCHGRSSGGQMDSKSAVLQLFPQEVLSLSSCRIKIPLREAKKS